MMIWRTMMYWSTVMNLSTMMRDDTRMSLMVMRMSCMMGSIWSAVDQTKQD